MIILAIESSCDETAAAIIGDNAAIISNIVVSQVDIFAAYGGVIPEVAARSHLEAILPVIHKALDDAHLTRNDIDYIAVTYAPGLLGSLLIGTLTARMLAILWDKPLYAIHHLKSHIYANWLSDDINNNHLPSSKTINNQCASTPNHLQYPKAINNQCASTTLPQTSPSELSVSADNDKSHSEENVAASGANHPFLGISGGHDRGRRCAAPATAGGRDIVSQNGMNHANSYAPIFPLLSLVISGGHTQIIYMPAHNQFDIIGTTRDDAVGECFDKVAKVLGLPYPGGPSIAKAALTGDPHKYLLPHPKIDGLDFSFSGLKTAVLRAVQSACDLPITTPSFELSHHLTPQQKSDFAASFQFTACDILLEKLHLALQQHPDVKSIVFAGGVSANQILRSKAYDKFPDLPIFFPELKFTGDNAAMVGAAAYYEILSGVQPVDPYHLDILPRTPIK